MNIETGELRRLITGCGIPQGFVELSDCEAVLAGIDLGERESVILPKNHPLRLVVTARVKKEIRKNKKSNRKAVKKSRMMNRR